MKKVILFLFCAIFFCVTPSFADDTADKDTSNKVVVQSLSDFSFENKSQEVHLRVMKGNAFENGITLEKDSILTAKVTKVIDPKRGKRNGYLIVEPICYTIPPMGDVKNVEENAWVAKVLGYKPFDVKKVAAGAGFAVAGHFIKGIGQFYYFGKGIMHPENGESRLVSGVKNVYENSPLAYIEEGEEAKVQTGDLLLLKFYYEDVSVWKFWQRNK